VATFIRFEGSTKIGIIVQTYWNSRWTISQSKKSPTTVIMQAWLPSFDTNITIATATVRIPYYTFAFR